jgi:chaperone required for assembly of F1-ATPase
LYASLAALVYVAIEITLVILHSTRVWFALHNENGDMWENIFHYIEFWSAAMFNVITGVVLHNSTSDTFHELARKWPVFINRLALLNIVTSSVAALLVSIDLRYFETVSHQIEYVADFCMILVMAQHALHYNFN